MTDCFTKYANCLATYKNAKYNLELVTDPEVRKELKRTRKEAHHELERLKKECRAKHIENSNKGCWEYSRLFAGYYSPIKWAKWFGPIKDAIKDNPALGQVTDDTLDEIYLFMRDKLHKVSKPGSVEYHKLLDHFNGDHEKARIAYYGWKMAQK